MAALDVITLQDLKAYFAPGGSSRDPMLRTWITVASRILENELGRRLVYRAPLEVATGDNIVVDGALANGALALAGQPNSAGRNVVVTILDANRSLTAGQLTVTGTVAGVVGVTEIFDLAAFVQQSFDASGFLRLYGTKFFTAISGASIANAAGNDGADKIRVGTSLGYVEYHTPRRGDCELWSLEWPVLSVLEINEDTSRSYGSGTKLTLSTDYVLDLSEGKFTRVAGQLPFYWLSSWRSQRLVYSAGYANALTVPEDVKDICRRLVVLLFQEVDKGRIGISGASDPGGNWTRFGPSKLTSEMRDQLEAYRRRRFGTDTGEREFDLEAA
jgi:hypothetical protein